ncbi:zinc-ribbon domain-containing protein [Adlercreutzia rubneri]
MSYCRQCGKELEASARFCPACGTSVEAISAPTTLESSQSIPILASASAAEKAKSAKIIAGVLNAALVVLAFMPWVNVNLYIWGDSYSIPALLDMANTVREWGSPFGSVSGDIDGAVAGLSAVILVVLAAWLAVVVLLARDAYRYFTNKSGFGSAGSTAMCVLSALFLLVVFSFDQLNNSSSGVPSGMISATLWVWCAVALSITAFIYSEVKEKEIDWNALVDPS